jgi:signal transduction histidine kinase
MIALPVVSPELLEDLFLNFAIITTLVLLYSFIPDMPAIRTGHARSLLVGLVFAIAAAVSIPAFWLNESTNLLGLNLVLVPLSGYIGGPVSCAIVAVTLIAGGVVSNEPMVATEVLTLTNGVLLGSLFYYIRTKCQFLRRVHFQIILLGTGIALIELISFIAAEMIGKPASAAIPTSPSGFITIIPFLLASAVVTIFLGEVILFIDRKKQAERELLDHKVHLEEIVRQRTAELEHVNSLQQATIDSTADGIVVVDRNERIRAYNWKAAQILRLPQQHPEMISNQVHNFPDQVMRFTEVTATLLEDPGSFRALTDSLPESVEKILAPGLRFKNGSIYELYVQPHRIGSDVIGRVFSFHDITDLKLAEESLTAANNTLILLSGITRHDIFNQMTALSAYLELAVMEHADPAMQSQINAMKKSLEVIRLQLEFTRDYEELGLKKPGWVDVEAIFSKTAEPFMDKGTDISCEIQRLEIFSDPMIGQVFHNLIDNSLRHGEHISRIRLLAERSGADLLLTYEDNGIGIVPADKEKIFQKGFGKHTGLGMFLIKEILSITGMRIRESGIYGHGARFEILVPAGKFRFTS